MGPGWLEGFRASLEPEQAHCHSPDKEQQVVVRKHPP